MTLSQRAPASAPRSELSLTGEFVLQRDDFQQIAAILHADAGIHLPESKTSLVYARLAKRLRSLGLQSFRDYCTLITSSDGADERQQMLAALTTNVTRFFREGHHFEHLKQKVLPPLLDRAKRGDRVRIWSAACSSGQEPYSIALTILSIMPDAAQYDIKILATDIDPNMVAQGTDGIYSEELLNDVPRELAKRWFDAPRPGASREWQANGVLRSLVAFRELNLHGTWPMKQQFHAIFCRNVVIYFEADAQTKIWSRFMPALYPGGYLYIGHSERLSGKAATAFSSEGITTYRLGGAA